MCRWSNLALMLPLLLCVLATCVSAGNYFQLTDFGANPSNLNAFIYTPTTIAPHPPLIVALHWCTGSAQAIYQGAPDLVNGADRFGYILLYPEAIRSSHCFDVYTKEALTRDGGSDPVSIVSMTRYTMNKYSVDPARVFATGVSSGAMMSNVLAALYPDLFTAAAAFSGVPFSCFATVPPSEWSSDCSTGSISHTAAQWADAAHQAYPGYHGNYPRMQLWHGTQDTALSYVNFGEEIKQWTALHGIDQTPVYTDHPQSSTWTRTRYGGTGSRAPVEAISVEGAAHTLPLPGMWPYALEFFGVNILNYTCATDNGGCGPLASTACALDSNDKVVCTCRAGYTGSPPAVACVASSPVLASSSTSAAVVNACALNNGGCGSSATTLCTADKNGAALCSCVSGYTGKPPAVACTPSPASCAFTATDVGSNAWWLAYNMQPTAQAAAASVKSVVAKQSLSSGASSTLSLSGPSNWGTDKSSVYSASASSPGFSVPFYLIVTDTTGAATTIAITSFNNGAKFAC